MRKGLYYADRQNLLLQLDSDEKLDIMCRDCGRLYLWIIDEDLATKNFATSCLILRVN